MKKLVFLMTLFLLPLSLVFAGGQICKVNFSQPQANCENATINCDTQTLYNSAYGKSWLMHNAGHSFIEVTCDVPEERLKESISLNLLHLSSYCNGHIYSPIKISINGQVYQEKVVPNSSNWVWDAFDISKQLKPGKNSIRLDLLSDAIGNYWINEMLIISE